MHFFVQFIRSRVPAGWTLKSGGWLSGNCPVCVHNGEARNDVKRRGGFQFGEDEWVYHCFNCHFATGWKVGQKITDKNRLLLKGFGVEEAEIQRMSLELLREEETTRFLNPMQEETPAFVPEWPTVDLPAGSTLLLHQDSDTIHPNFVKGIEMLQQRQLLHWTDWAYTSSDFKFKKRTILPFRYKGNIVGHTARYIGTPPNDLTPKYLRSTPPNFVFNLDRQSRSRKLAIVTEGDFDAIVLDGMALGSNSVSEGQASLINELKKKTILLPDADKPGSELIEPAIKNDWSVSFPEWMDTHKDAASAAEEYGRSFVLKSVIDAAISNPTKIRVLARKYLK